MSRTPKENAALGALLAHRENEKLIGWTLRRCGYPRQDLQDGIQDVYVKTLEYLERHPAPDTLERMMALCSVIARNHAIDEIRKEQTRKTDLETECERNEYGWIEREPVTRDPVDAERQLEVLADLFREGKVPPRGVDILEGVAFGRSHPEIAEELGITDNAVEKRMRRMEEVYRRRLAKLGLLPNGAPLRVVVSKPGAIGSLRRAA